MKPSARRSSSATSSGAKQIAVVNDKRIVVVSGGPSSASARRAPRTPAAPANDSAGQEMAATLDDLHAKPPLFIPGRQPASQAHAFSSRLSSFRKRQSVPSAMILLRARLDHADLVQAQRVEAHRVLGVVLAPLVVGDLVQRLEGIVVAACVKPPSTSCRATRSGSATQRSAALRIGAHHALGRDRILADELAVARQHAAEVLRPGLVQGAVDDHVADVPGAQLLRLGRKAEEGIDLALGEQLHRLGPTGS